MQTLDEIRQQPEKHRLLSEKYPEVIQKLKNLILDKKPKEINFVGCGSSYYLAMGLSRHFNRLSDGEIRSNYYSGSEIMFGLSKLPADSLLIGLSRSGESSETIGALETARDCGAYTAAVTCEPGSTMTRVADVTAEMDFIEEKSIVMTKSFTSMAFLISALAKDLFSSGNLESYLKEIPELSKKVLDDAEALFEKLNPGKFEHFVFLGYDEYFSAAMEGVIKVTETSLSDVDCYQTLEYRHGPKSKIKANSLAVILANSKMYGEEEKMAHEIMELGGTVISIASRKFQGTNGIEIPYEKDDFGDWFLRVILLQLIGIRRAVAKGLDPDKPTHLSKVVKF